MTVQELYDLCRKVGDSHKIEIRLRPADNLVKVEFDKDDGDVFAHLIAEAPIRL